jgi:predicted transcriptional regulator
MLVKTTLGSTLMNENPASPPQSGPHRLKEIALQLKRGDRPALISVRELLEWFGAQRRGSYIVEEIRDALSKANLTTNPDFATSYIDGEIQFLSEERKGQPAAHATYRVGMLSSANRAVVSVNPNTTISEAIYIMMHHNYSQLPVMSDARHVKGVISWASIGRRMAVGVKCSEVRECMETPPHEIGASASLLDAIPEIAKKQYVLVRDSTNKISGIVTASDLSFEFLIKVEPFLLLEEIENHVRRLIERGRFTRQDLINYCEVDEKNLSPADALKLTIGDYVCLLQKPQAWNRLQLELNQKRFVADLDEVRTIRNDVMHFNPDPILPAELDALRNFVGYLRQLRVALPGGS